MSLLTLLQDAAVELKQPTFSSVINNTNQGVKLLLAVANAEVRACARDRDWPRLTKTGTVTLGSAPDGYALPGDFQRFTRDTFWDTTATLPVFGPMTPAEYAAGLYASVSSGISTFYRIEGWTSTTLKIFPTTTVADLGRILAYRYQSATVVKPQAWGAGQAWAAGAWCYANGYYWKTTAGGTSGATVPDVSDPTVGAAIVSDGGVTWMWDSTLGPYDKFLNDTDESAFGDDVTKLGVKWRFLRANGFDYGQEYGEYIEAVKAYYCDQVGEGSIMIGGGQPSPRHFVGWDNLALGSWGD